SAAAGSGGCNVGTFSVCVNSICASRVVCAGDCAAAFVIGAPSITTIASRIAGLERLVFATGCVGIRCSAPLSVARRRSQRVLQGKVGTKRRNPVLVHISEGGGSAACVRAHMLVTVTHPGRRGGPNASGTLEVARASYRVMLLTAANGWRWMRRLRVCE